MKKIKKKIQKIEEVKEDPSRLLTVDQFEHVEIAIQGGIESKSITEKEAAQFREIINGLKGKDNMAVIKTIITLLPLLKAGEILAVTEMMKDAAKKSYIRELLEELYTLKD